MHRYIFDELESSLRAGVIAPGDRLPTESQLSKKYGTSRTTAIRALRDLASAGLVQRRQGSGTYAVDIPLPSLRSIAFCSLFVRESSELGYVEGLIQRHLADIASGHQATLHVQCLPANGRTIRDSMRLAADALVARKIAGCLYYPAELPQEDMDCNRIVVDRLREAGINVVLIDRDIVSYPQRSEFVRIGYDNRRGGTLVTNHLLEVGCKRVAFVGIPEVSTAVQDRLAGYSESLQNHGLAASPDLIWSTDSPTEAFCKQLLKLGRPDGIVCKSDRFAAMLGRHLTSLGVKIGHDIKLAGFDDDPIASFLPVPLTSVRLPARPFAEAAFEAVLPQVESIGNVRRQVIIDCELAIRASTTG
ncbi:GntR family transcriptional regulator [Lacipirellula sp.]|uniref:GntR family transcriptional regulator n=1 Tax=Lacipirellula sp. TaxID=2691419 RepID=UPI003D0ACC75